MFKNFSSSCCSNEDNKSRYSGARMNLGSSSKARTLGETFSWDHLGQSFFLIFWPDPGLFLFIVPGTSLTCTTDYQIHITNHAKCKWKNEGFVSRILMKSPLRKTLSAPRFEPTAVPLASSWFFCCLHYSSQPPSGATHEGHFYVACALGGHYN